MNENTENRNEKQEAGEINLDGKFVSWWSNFWYYNKWKVFFAAMAVLLVTVCTLQMCERDSTDLTLLYGGSCYIQSSDYKKISAAFSSVLPEDFNGDGKKVVDISSFHIYSEDEVNKRKEAAQTDSNVVEINTALNQRELASFDNLIVAGEYSIVICDPWLYKRVANGGGFRTLEDVLGYVPEEAYDEYAVRFKDLAFVKANSESFKGFDDDTLIAFRTESQLGNLTGKKRSQRIYNQNLAMFKSIIEYGK